MVARTLKMPEQNESRGSSPPRVQRSDSATSVVLAMRQLGVAGLPRNYELFYEAMTAGSKELSDALSALGSRPSQKQLDEIAEKFLSRSTEKLVSDAHREVTTRLDEILALLKKERHAIEAYGRILDETSNGLSTRQEFTSEFLEKIVNVTVAATRKSLEHQGVTTQSIITKSSELNDVKLKLEEYKRLAETDALTQLRNRRAFDRRLTEIYASNRNITFSALLMIDIDRFKTINDRFGHPVGDRILQIIANIITATAKPGTFVARTGGEEFALILDGFGEEACAQLGDDIRQAIMTAPFINVASGANYGPITVSVGTCMATQAQNPDDLYTKADRALYSAKSSGRNRVTRFSSLSDGNFTKNWQLYK